MRDRLRRRRVAMHRNSEYYLFAAHAYDDQTDAANQRDSAQCGRDGYGFLLPMFNLQWSEIHILLFVRE